MRIGMIARMNESSKNQVLFLRTATSVASWFPLAEFVLASDGPFHKEWGSWHGNSASALGPAFGGNGMISPGCQRHSIWSSGPPALRAFLIRSSK
jgi:hypothetical protein